MPDTAGTAARHRFGGLALVLLTLLGWSSVPLFIKHFAQHIDVWTSNGWRYGFSALLWAPLLAWAASRRAIPPGLWAAAVIPSIFNAAGQVAFAQAHYMIDPGLLTFGLRLQILFVAVGAAILFPAERRIIRAPLFILGLLMVFGGTMGAVALGEGFGRAATLGGVLLAVASGFCFAAYALSIRHFMHRVNPLIAFAAISQYTAAAMVALMLLFGRGGGIGALQLPEGQFSLLLVSAVIGIALGHVLYYASIARLGVAVSAGVIQLQPFLVAAASFFFFAERLSPAQWSSGMVAVAGAACILSVQHHLSRRALPVDVVAAVSADDTDES